MADWNPSLYLQFDAERTRPAADLLSTVSSSTPILPAGGLRNR